VRKRALVCLRLYEDAFANEHSRMGQRDLEKDATAQGADELGNHFPGCGNFIKTTCIYVK